MRRIIDECLYDRTFDVRANAYALHAALGVCLSRDISPPILATSILAVSATLASNLGPQRFFLLLATFSLLKLLKYQLPDHG